MEQSQPSLSVDQIDQDPSADQASARHGIECDPTGERALAQPSFGPVPTADPDVMPLPATSDSVAELALLRIELQERDDLLDHTAQELRNSMHALSGQMLAIRKYAEIASDPLVAERLKAVELSFVRFTDRASVLLDLTRLDARPYPIWPKEIDLSTLVAEVVDRLRREAEFHGLVIRLRLPLSCRACADPLVIDQILSNLLRNAFKHSGGHEVIVMLCQSSASELQLTVEDDGNGIPIAVQSGISAKFKGSGRPRFETGFGLGLWIVTQLAEAMDGNFSAESSLNLGSRFTLRIPSATQHFPSDHDPRQSKSAS